MFAGLRRTLRPLYPQPAALPVCACPARLLDVFYQIGEGIAIVRQNCLSIYSFVFSFSRSDNFLHHGVFWAKYTKRMFRAFLIKNFLFFMSPMWIMCIIRCITGFSTLFYPFSVDNPKTRSFLSRSFCKKFVIILCILYKTGSYRKQR